MAKSSFQTMCWDSWQTAFADTDQDSNKHCWVKQASRSFSSAEDCAVQWLLFVDLGIIFSPQVSYAIEILLEQ